MDPVAFAAAFTFTLLNPNLEPYLDMDTSGAAHHLEFTLTNTTTDTIRLAGFPFNMDPGHFHQLKFAFNHAYLDSIWTTDTASWHLSIGPGSQPYLDTLYVQFAGEGTKLAIPPGPANAFHLPLQYTFAQGQSFVRDNTLEVGLYPGDQIFLGGDPLRDVSASQTLYVVQPNAYNRGATPLALSLTGRSTILNDGVGYDQFTFTLSNIMPYDLQITPVGQPFPTTLKVWFDVAANTDTAAAWALARLGPMDSLQMRATDTTWFYANGSNAMAAPRERSHGAHRKRMPASAAKTPAATPAVDQRTPVNNDPWWEFQAGPSARPIAYQGSMDFTCSRLKCDVYPGSTRMYVQFRNVPGFHDGVLVTSMQKQPSQFGATRGTGTYIEAGLPAPGAQRKGATGSALVIQQFDPTQKALEICGGSDTGHVSLSYLPPLPDTAYLSQDWQDYYEQWLPGFQFACTSTPRLSIDSVAQFSSFSIVADTTVGDTIYTILGKQSVLFLDSMALCAYQTIGTITAPSITSPQGFVSTPGLLIGPTDQLAGTSSPPPGTVCAFGGAVTSTAVYSNLTDPFDRTVRYNHGLLTGPESAVYHRGTAHLQNGRAVVHLPDYVAHVVDSTTYTVQLTNVDGFDRLCVRTQNGAKVRNGAFIVASADSTSQQMFDWEVKAVRSDIAKLEVLPKKEARPPGLNGLLQDARKPAHARPRSH